MAIPISDLSSLPGASVVGSSASNSREWGFVETLRGAMDQMQELQSTGDKSTAALIEGTGMDVHSAMIAVEKADLSFQLMMQVRSKIVAAYQEISRMQF
jgi:flagellar hook-basal body complex protein FliE